MVLSGVFLFMKVNLKFLINVDKILVLPDQQLSIYCPVFTPKFQE